ncbi:MULTISPECIES: hypothetical protein [Streptomyces]|uniref:hypothetical protein n=1 Tax=Streptomyces lycopersici TaxID=2974589 RepID=UPI0021D186C4|nr:hypothetical protein [Streptomyces sp. NEAU-383]
MKWVSYRSADGSTRCGVVHDNKIHAVGMGLLELLRAEAKKNGSTRKRKLKRRTGQLVRRGGREPLGLGTAITSMMTERGMVARPPVAASSCSGTTSSPRAAPELTGHAQAVKFDMDAARLDAARPDVVPDAPVYGTKRRWSAPKLIAAANTEVPGANVRGLHVLPPASSDAGSASAAADPDLRSAAPEMPVRTRETVSPGYQQALAAHQASRPAGQQAGACPRPEGRGYDRAAERRLLDARAGGSLRRWAGRDRRAAGESGAGGSRGQQPCSRAAEGPC